MCVVVQHYTYRRDVGNRIVFWAASRYGVQNFPTEELHGFI